MSAPIAYDTLVKDERIDASRDETGILLAGDTASRPILLAPRRILGEVADARTV